MSGLVEELSHQFVQAIVAAKERALREKLCGVLQPGTFSVVAADDIVLINETTWLEDGHRFRWRADGVTMPGLELLLISGD